MESKTVKTDNFIFEQWTGSLDLGDFYRNFGFYFHEKKKSIWIKIFKLPRYRGCIFWLQLFFIFLKHWKNVFRNKFVSYSKFKSVEDSKLKSSQHNQHKSTTIAKFLWNSENANIMKLANDIKHPCRCLIWQKKIVFILQKFCICKILQNWQTRPEKQKFCFLVQKAEILFFCAQYSR